MQLLVFLLYAAGEYHGNDENSVALSTASSAAILYSCRVCLKLTYHNRHESHHFCDILPAEYQSTKDFRVRVARKSLSCFKCDKTFFTTSAITLHQKQHLFSTSRSAVVCRSGTELKKKRSVQRAAYYTCELCGKVFKYHPSFLIHLQRHGFTTNAQKVIHSANLHL